VERDQRTHTEEFYEVADSDFTVVALQDPLREWERVYNTVRPHQALGYLTPQQYLLQCQQRKEDVSPMYQTSTPSAPGPGNMNPWKRAQDCLAE
jgi:hypothetical protein